jgi:hypothetical protein
MYLYEKGKRRPYCWECGKVHDPKACPKRVNWEEIERAADDFYARMDAYWSRRLEVA